jgi:hypothetical protein
VGYPDSTHYSKRAESNENGKNNGEAKFYVVINIDLLRSVKQVSVSRTVILLHAKRDVHFN